MRQELKELLIRHEGMVLLAYEDTVGKITVGVGRNLDDVGLTKEEAIYLLNNDMDRVEKEVRITFTWFEGLDEVRQNVVLNMVFNLGINRFSKFINTINAIKHGSYVTAADEMLDSKWARQVGHRADELSEMMRTGAYPSWVS